MTDPSLTRAFNVNGLALSITAGSRQLLDAGCSMIEPFAASAADPASWRITLRQAPASRAWVEDRPFVARGVDERGLDWQLHYGQEGSAVWVADRTAARVDLARKSAEVRAIAGAEDEVPITAMIVVLDDFLTAVGQFMVHAACLRVSEEKDSPMVLLFAPSGTGKTTTSLALAREGLPLVSDDAAILSLRDGGVTAWGLPRATKVHQQTAAMLPWLSAVLQPFAGPSEQVIGLPALRTLIPVAAPTPADVRLIVALDKPNPAGHRLEPMTAAAAVEHMAVENIRPVDRSAKGVAAKRLAVLARTAAEARACKLTVGPDPRGLGKLLRQALAG